MPDDASPGSNRQTRLGAELALEAEMGPAFGAAVDVAHAAAMAMWVLGLPLLFWHRWPRITRAYAAYALAFVALNLLSQWLLGECFLTTLSRAGWEGTTTLRTRPDEWFTVRLAQTVFRATPSHEVLKRVSEALIAATAVGALFTGHKTLRTRPSTPANRA